MTTLSFFLQGVALGLAAAATPGAFQAYLITQSIMNGFQKGRIIAFAPLISDPPVVIAVLLILNQLPQSFLILTSLAGGIFVIYLAVNTFKQWRNPSKAFNDDSTSGKVNLFHGAVLNVLSPGLYLYWTLVNGPLLKFALEQSLIYGLAFLIGFYGFFIGGMVSIAAIFAQTRRLGEKFIKIMLLMSTMILFGFGIFLIWRSFSQFFR